MIDPDLQYSSPLCKLAAGVAGIVYALGLLGGGIYCILTFTQYTGWAIAGGVGLILAGALCYIHSVGVILRFSAQEKTHKACG